MKYSEELFGSSELTLRLPNILALILYLVYAVGLFYKNTKELALPFFLIIVLNPYLLDFFGLARGYGLSFAFMLMSLYHLIAYFKSRLNKDLILFNAAALLASLSNFTLLNYYFAALITFNILIFLEAGFKAEKFNFYRANKINLVSVLFSIIVLWEPLRRITKKNMLDFGGKNGFIEDTIGSLVNGLSYENPFPSYTTLVLNLTFAFTILLILALIIPNILRRKAVFFENNKALITVNFILVLIAGASFLQHLILNNDFYVGRFALFLYPLFVLNLAFLLHFLFLKGKKLATVSISLLIVLGICVNFFININLSHCKDWGYDMETKTVMGQLRTEQSYEPSIKKITLGINWLFEPSTNFYRYIWDLNWLQQTDREGIEKKYDYYYIFSSDSNAHKLKDKKVIFRSERNGIILSSGN